MICKRCGAKNNDNAVFCMNCGVKIGSGVRIFNENNTIPASIRTKSPALIILSLIFAIVAPIVGIILGVVGRFYYTSRLQKRKVIYNIIVACGCLLARIILFILLVLLIILVLLVVAIVISSVTALVVLLILPK